MDEKKAFCQMLEAIKARIGKESYERWFSPLEFRGKDSQKLVIEAPNQFWAQWVWTKFQKELKEESEKLWNEPLNISFVFSDSKESDFSVKPVENLNTDELIRYANLNPKYSFENFVVGPSNQLAHAACLAVADGKSSRYNPLFIYGGVGLGKTHLLNAIGKRALQKREMLRVIFIPAENFMNELIQNVRTDRMPEFRKKFRKNCDLLLMDDIQILCGKERTQEEFFHTFNELYESGKQIVITSDRFPSEMPELEDRLRSRFECGIIVDIQPPEFETKLAIIHAKAEEYQINIPDEVAELIARKVQSNIRRLEGALIRLSAYASISGENITLKMVEEVLSNLLEERSSQLNPEQILKLVARKFGLKPSDLKGKKRDRKFAYPRQIAMYLCRELTNSSYPEIGELFGGKDHATVMHACRKLREAKCRDLETKSLILEILRELKVNAEMVDKIMDN